MKESCQDEHGTETRGTETVAHEYDPRQHDGLLSVSAQGDHTDRNEQRDDNAQDPLASQRENWLAHPPCLSTGSVRGDVTGASKALTQNCKIPAET